MQNILLAKIKDSEWAIRMVGKKKNSVWITVDNLQGRYKVYTQLLCQLLSQE